MKKKNIFILLCIIVIIFIAGIITRNIDSSKIKTNNEPKYCIKTVSYDGKKVTYWGLGYKVIRYVGISPQEPYKSNIGVKMGSWFMNYQFSTDDSNNKEKVTQIKSLDDFYNTELTKQYDIRKLNQEYNSFDAQKDNCFVIGAMVHNDYLYGEFMGNYKNKVKAFIRVAQNTAEGDIILYDILYDEKEDKLYLVTDSTRDEFSSEKNRKIELKEFRYISEYEFENHLYWILYNQEINKDNFYSDNVFVITTIN